MTHDFTTTLPRKRMGAAVLLSDDRGRVLLVEPTYKDHWEIPGGAVEADESPYAAAMREVDERLSNLLTRRIMAAVQARADGTTVYLENGFFVA
ncbi:NUDIX hydrolase [Actinoplanes sp. NPDC051346]|uniref:NUDIX hydrolase n=1 Tax=Actinoplanes sp. NPDC051346 TaxID=3155048 RepID=UPI0034326DEF